MTPTEQVIQDPRNYRRRMINNAQTMIYNAQTIADMVGVDVNSPVVSFDSDDAIEPTPQIFESLESQHGRSDLKSK